MGRNGSISPQWGRVVVPRIGIVGAGISQLVSSIVGAVLVISLNRDIFLHTFQWRWLCQCGAPVLGVILLAYLWRSSSDSTVGSLEQLLAGAVVFVTGLLITRYVRVAELSSTGQRGVSFPNPPVNIFMSRTSQLKAVSIGGREISSEHPVYIIAEAGVNHCGDIGLAKRLIDASVDAGADAVKFQTFRAERLASAEAGKAAYQVSSTGSAETHLEMLMHLELPADAFAELARYCEMRGITFLSTPFDEESVDLLSDLGVPAFKISSGDLTNIPFLRYVAARQRPVILSTGMASVDEAADAVACLRNAGCDSIIVLHCVSSYPADPGDANLRAMATLQGRFACADRVFRPHHRAGSGNRGGCARCVCHRKAFDHRSQPAGAGPPFLYDPDRFR